MVGKLDPATGYRIEYTVSALFQQEDMLKLVKHSDQERLEFVRFRPAVENAVDSGVNAAEGTKSAPPLKDRKPVTLAFSEATITSGFDKGTVLDKQGYITVDNSHSQYGKQLYLQRLTISGCPATWSAYENPIKPRSEITARYYLLMIKLPGKSRVYEFVAIAEGKELEDEAQAEFTAIRDSIQIVKVSQTQTNGKHG